VNVTVVSPPQTVATTEAWVGNRDGGDRDHNHYGAAEAAVTTPLEVAMEVAGSMIGTDVDARGGCSQD
jgi:hypothetical protein